MKAWMLLVVLLVCGVFAGAAQATDRVNRGGRDAAVARAIRAAQLQRDIDRELALRELERRRLRSRGFFRRGFGFGLFF